ncbi:MAG: DsbA family protein [Nanoarchaeota archaeon]|nr:DsbA family protein [Nanoarchaeota archaeon]MBU0976949.1 DsbA family protein [Nanoarchaeota archaeon]
MVLCWIALPVFAVLAIFSARYRRLTVESLECLFRTATLQKCQSGLDDRMKSQITGKLLRFSPASARFFYKHYKIISFVLLIVFIWSTYISAVAIYNYIEYGNCNGPDSDGFCILDPMGENSATCEIPNSVGGNGKIVYPKPDPNTPVIGNRDAELTIIEFGCYVCPYTNDAEETVKAVLDYYKGRVNLQFIVYPLPAHEFSYESSMASKCAEEQGKYEEYHEKLFEQNLVFTSQTFMNVALELELDVGQFESCMENQTYASDIEKDKALAVAAGVKGTPTFFVNEQEIIGPKPFKTFKTVIDGELGKLG